MSNRYRVLVACEESQTVCKAFRDIGFEAWSCDIAPCSGGHPEWHIEADVLPILNIGWDMIIAHPPCTYLSCVGNRHLSPKCNPQWKIEQRLALRSEAIDFFLAIYNAPCEKIAVENPTGCMTKVIGKPTQTIHPYHFGDPFMKRTCLWLKGLPPLVHTNVLQKPEPLFVSNGPLTKGKKINWVEGISGCTVKERRRLRSVTFPGIALAMAKQWGEHLLGVASQP